MAISFDGNITPGRPAINTTRTSDGAVVPTPEGPLYSGPVNAPPKPRVLNDDTPAKPSTGSPNVGNGSVGNCMLSSSGLALGETPILLSGTITERFNRIYPSPHLNIIQTDGIHRMEAARRISAADPDYNWVFVDTGYDLADKCSVNLRPNNKYLIPSTNIITFIQVYFDEYGEWLFIGEDLSLYRLERIGGPPPLPPDGGGLGTGKIYTPIEDTDKLRDIVECVTKGMWSANVGNLLTFFTSSLQNTGSRLYNLEVRNKVDTDCQSEVQFSIAYGHSGGSGSYDLGGFDYLTPTKAVYGQYAGLCLDPPARKFNIAGSVTDSIYVVNVRRARMGDVMDPGNWELNLAHLSGSEFTSGGGNRNAYTGSNIQLKGTAEVLRLIDDSKMFTSSLYSGGPVHRVVSGSIESGIYNSTSPEVYGLSYPNLGIVVLDSTKLDARAGFLTVTGSEVSASNSHQLLTAISGAAMLTDLSGDYLGFQARKEQRIHSTIYYVRVKNAEYNYTNNPTYVTGDSGDIHPDFITDSQVYLTQIGFYNARRELLAVGKISKPVKKTCTEEALFTVKLKYE